MQFAQNVLKLGRDASPALRGYLRGADGEEYAEALKDSWDAAVVQMSAGHLNAGIEFLMGDSFVLYRENWAQRLHTAGELQPGMISFGMSDGNGLETRWWGQQLPVGYMPFLIAGTELKLVTEPNEAMIVLMMAEQDFRQIFERLTGVDSQSFIAGGHFIAVQPEALPGLRDCWKQILARTAGVSACPLSLVDLVSPLIDAMILPLQAHRACTPKAGVFDAVMHTAEQMKYGASVPELSQYLHFSRRAIEYAFQEHLGVSPHAYFTLRRLDLCKQSLAKADPATVSVTAIAIQHGFRELGRFAAIYRRRFGELPSETLRTSRCTIPVGVALMRSEGDYRKVTARFRSHTTSPQSYTQVFDR